MLFAALSNAVCLYNASFFPFISANAFCFHALSWSIGVVVRMSIFYTKVAGSNLSINMFSP